jgi:hypothetical protein
MTIKLYDPVGDTGPIETVMPSRLDTFEQGRIGYVFNHHPAAEEIWMHMEANLQRMLQPQAIERIDKENVAISVPKAKLEQLAGITDCVLVGVGA